MPSFRSVCWVLLLTGAAAAAAAAPPEAVASAYEIELEAMPATGRVAVAARVTVVRDNYLAPELAFRLHDRFDIQSLKVNDQELPFSSRSASADPLRPASREVVVPLPENLRRPQLELEVAYGGPLAALPQFASPRAADGAPAMDDAVGDHRVELSYYSSWYPQLSDFGGTFAADLAVTLPTGWTVVCSGEPAESQELEGRHRSRWVTPTATDLVVVASPDFQVVPIRRGDGTVEIYHTRLPSAFVDREADNVRRTLELYADLLGEPEGRLATVRVVYSPREYGQGGYSRAPMVVLSEGRVIAALRKDPRLSLLRGTAHEAGHFWWRFGTGQGDWINEAFAEYFALGAVEQVDSRAHYEGALARAAAAVGQLPADAPALAEVPASNRGNGATIRYQKGALMLAWIRSVLGDDAFFAACRDFYQARHGTATGTEDFRAFWSARVGAERAPALEAWLTSSGGAPSEAYSGQASTGHAPANGQS